MSNPDSNAGVEIFMKVDYWAGRSYALRYELKKGDPALSNVYLKYYKNFKAVQLKKFDPQLIKATLLLKGQPKFVKKLQKNLDLDLDLGEASFRLMHEWTKETKPGQGEETQNREKLDKRDIEIILRPSFSTYLEARRDKHTNIVNFLLPEAHAPLDVCTFDLLKELKVSAEALGKRIKEEEEKELEALIEKIKKEDNRNEEIEKEMDPILGTLHAHGSSSDTKEKDKSATKPEVEKGSNKASGHKPASGHAKGGQVHGKNPGR